LAQDIYPSVFRYREYQCMRKKKSVRPKRPTKFVFPNKFEYCNCWSQSYETPNMKKKKTVSFIHFSSICHIYDCWGYSFKFRLVMGFIDLFIISSVHFKFEVLFEFFCSLLVLVWLFTFDCILLNVFWWIKDSNTVSSSIKPYINKTRINHIEDVVSCDTDVYSKLFRK